MKMDFEISIDPSVDGLSVSKSSPQSKRGITGAAVGSHPGFILLQEKKWQCDKCLPDTIDDVEDIIVHETLHHVCHELSGDVAYWNLDNLCYPIHDFGLGFGLVLQNFMEGKNET